MISKPNVFIICTGVGHINRGYESFTLECFSELKESSKFEMFLLKGGGRSVEKELKISCVKRNTKTALFLSKITGKEVYWIEQFTFLIGMLPALFKYRPAVIYYSDFILGTFLWHLRRFLKFKYKLLFSNGAPNGPPFSTMDHVQQLLEVYRTQAVKDGAPLEMQTLLPYGFDIRSSSTVTTAEQNKQLRQRLNLPANKKIIISVGAINDGHKRMGYVIKEFATLDYEQYFLLLLGQIDDKSKPVINLASEILKPGSYLITEVSPADVALYLSVSDHFILASLKEGFGRVLIEAQQAGLLPIVHDYPVVREVLGPCGIYADLTQTNVLLNLIKQADASNLTKEDLRLYAYDNYSWEKLNDHYEQMIAKLIQ